MSDTIVTETVEAKMRDGTKLKADVAHPSRVVPPVLS
jgi:predicted acyl esterase